MASGTSSRRSAAARADDASSTAAALSSDAAESASASSAVVVERRYPVVVKLAANATMGDTLYTEMSSAEIDDLLSGRALWIPIPEDAYTVHPQGEMRFVNMQSIVELQIKGYRR